MSLCRRPYIDRRKEFSEEERDRLTKIDNEIWEKAKDSKLFFKVYPLVGKPGYQIKNNASINSVYNFVSEINKKYDKKIVKLSKTTEFKKEILSVNVMPLSRETIRESYIQNLQAKNQQRIDARRSGIDYSEDYLFQESDTVDQDLGLEQRLFSESKDTTSLEILNKIANSDHNLASLAAHLIPYAKYVNAKISLVENIKPSSIAKNPNGAYNPNTGDIVIKKTAGFTASRAEATILHEIIHSLTYYELRKGTEENAYFTELFNHAELYLGTLNLYGLSNKDEFMTALFTDADFVKQLQNVPPLNKKKYTNLFQEVFDKILKLLKITKSSPFYEEAFSTATNIIENFRQREVEKIIQKEEYAKEYEEYLKSSAYEESLYSEEQTNIKPGVKELFNSNPELSSIGTPEQYSQYLNTIFPDSKVKDIVYHGTRNQFAEFRKTNIAFLEKLNIKLNRGTYFSTNKEHANYLKTIDSRREGMVISALINLKNPHKPLWDHVLFNSKKYDGLINYNKKDLNFTIDEFAVFEPKQIHILGSKQDIKGFKEFVSESTQTVESQRAQEQAELSQRIPNIENYKVDGKVVKSLITDENDLKTYNKIYDKYDALITPLLETSEESTNTVKNKIAINKLFKSLPILDTIGTEEQYLRHFNSVYSDTSVPIVVYRAVKHEGSELKDKSFFTDDPEYAIKYGDILKPYKLNILNPYISTKVGIHRASIGSMLEDPMVDGIIGKESLNNVSMRAVTIELQEAQEEGRYLSTEGAIRRLAGPLTDTNSFVTTNVNQVYELGTEIDVDNFKEFVRNDLGTKELNKKSVSLYSKIFDISEDEINEHLKNCG